MSATSAYSALWWAGALALAGAGVVLLLRRCSARVYDAVIIHMTALWYGEVFAAVARQRSATGTFKLLDVGIGTATALLAQKAQMLETGTAVTGVDYDAGYVAAARQSVKDAGVSSRVTLHCASIYDAPDLDAQVARDGLFDAGYFSGSFSLMPDPLEALLVVSRYVKPGGRVYITQTFQRRGVPGLAVIKPLMFWVTTIDFGKLFFEAELEDVLKRSKLKVVANRVIEGSVDNMFQAARFVELEVPQK